MKKICTFSFVALTSLAASFVTSPAFGGQPVQPVEPVQPAPTCSERFDWPDDLAGHVLNGPLDGSFDYDFPGAAITKIAGGYAVDEQLAWWDVGYADEHYLADAWVTGTKAFVSLDGDFEVRMTTTTSDRLGEIWVETVERTRWGCQEQRVLDPDGLALGHDGLWSAGRYDYTEQRPLAKDRELTTLIASVVGTLYDDGSSEATATYHQAGQEASTDIIVTEQRNLDGERWIEVSLTSLDAARAASTYIAADGTTTKTGYFGYDPRWDYGTTLNYGGIGSGWLHSDDVERYCYLDIGVVCTRSCWDLADIEELQEELEEEGVEWELEYGEYIHDLTPTVDHYCNDTLFEDYAITPF